MSDTKNMLNIGLKHTETFTVSNDLTAKTIQSGGLDVLATPALIAMMEKCAWQSVLSALEDGLDTVGTEITMTHLAPSPIGAKVTCTSELILINERELIFHIDAYDKTKKIGEATHKRFIIKISSFQNKAYSKSTK